MGRVYHTATDGIYLDAIYRCMDWFSSEIRLSHMSFSRLSILISMRILFSLKIKNFLGWFEYKVL